MHPFHRHSSFPALRRSVSVVRAVSLWLAFTLPPAVWGAVILGDFPSGKETRPASAAGPFAPGLLRDGVAIAPGPAKAGTETLSGAAGSAQISFGPGGEAPSGSDVSRSTTLTIGAGGLAGLRPETEAREIRFLTCTDLSPEPMSAERAPAR